MENLYMYCKPILNFGKIIGLIPFDCCLSNDNEVVKKGKMVTSVLGTTFVVLLWCDAMVGLQALAKTRFTNAANYVGAPMMFIYYAIGAFLYWYHHQSAQKLFRCFRRWNRLNLNLDLRDRHLKRDVMLIAVIVMGSAILENLTNNVRYAIPQDSFTDQFGYNPKNESFLKIYYLVSADQWSKLVPYSPMMSLYVLLSDKFTWYSWNLSDVLTLVFSRALYFKFKALYVQGELMTLEYSRRSVEENKRLWKHIAQDHFALWRLLKEIQEFLSPLVFVTVAINTYVICLQIHISLSEQSSGKLLDNIYAVWSVGHIWIRVWSICVAGSRLNEWAHKVIQLLRHCPSGAASLDVTRTERYGNHHTIAWTGMDCFTVTNNLLMKIIGVVLTFEIIILQAAHQGCT